MPALPLLRGESAPLRCASPAAPAIELRDRFGRVHRNLRLSVTDRCNLRCTYCMPEGEIGFLESDELLGFDEIVRVVGVLARCGIDRLRLTGGEPLLRRGLPELIGRLRQEVPGLREIALTTNGLLLPRLAEPLRRAGLQRLNISLDTLSEATFRRLSRRSGLHRVLSGIDAALAAGFEDVRLNALAIRGLSEAELIPLVQYAADRGLTMRFIEFMPLDAEHRWQAERVLSGEEILRCLAEHYGPLKPVPPANPAQPARDYQLPCGGRVGLIRPVTAPFCGDCDRLRLTAEGMLRNCLFSLGEWDLRGPLRAGCGDEDLLGEIRRCVAAKEAGHLIRRDGFEQPQRAMYQIGG